MKTLQFRWLLLALVLFSGAAEAVAQQGGLFVKAHISGATCAKTAGARMSHVYVYDTMGAKVMGTANKAGAHLPGEYIKLDAGDYWVAVGTREQKENLRKYTVEDGQFTVVPTGWISVATLTEADIAASGCNPWTANIRAYIKKGEELVLVADNSDAIKAPDAYGIIQLHPGTYTIEFNQFKTEVEVKSGQEYRIPTGSFGPALASDTWLLRNHQDDINKDGMLVCEGGEMHVIAGDYVLRQTVWRNDNSEKDFVYDRLTVEADGQSGYTTLATGTRVKKTREHTEADGVVIAAEAIGGLERWGKRMSSNDFDDLGSFKDDL